MGIKGAFSRPHLDGWRDSDLTLAAYCRQHGNRAATRITVV